MKFLIIDTSTEKSLVVIAKGEMPLWTCHLPAGLQSSRHLMPAIQSGFEKLRMSPSDLQAVAVTAGPGSFTGVRVGVAAAKGIAFGCSLPLIRLSALSGFVSQDTGRFASIIDARIGGAFLMIQERKEEQIIELTSPELVSLQDLEEKTQGCRALIGPSFQRLENVEGIERYPDEEHLAKIVYQKFLDQKFTDLERFEISYLREFSGSLVKAK